MWYKNIFDSGKVSTVSALSIGGNDKFQLLD